MHPFTHFISDTHFSHANLLSYEPVRQQWGADIEAHDAALIAAWNARVPQDGHVLHLGDVCFGPVERVQWIRARLHGTIYVVKGNHDRGPKALAALGFVPLGRRHEFTDDRMDRVVCRHDPSKFTGVDVGTADVLLFGHLHSARLPADAVERMRGKGLCLSCEAIAGLSAPGPLTLDMVRALTGHSRR